MSGYDRYFMILSASGLFLPANGKGSHVLWGTAFDGISHCGISHFYALCAFYGGAGYALPFHEDKHGLRRFARE